MYYVSHILENSYAYWSLVCFLIFIVWYILGTWNYDLYKKKGIPNGFCFPFVGNLVQIAWYGRSKFENYLVQKFGNFVGLYFGGLATLLISDVDVIKQFLVKDASSFIDRNTLFAGQYPFRKAVSSLTGKDWKRVRSLITPTFTTGKLKKMSPLITDSTHTLSLRLLKAAEAGKDVDIKAYSGSLTLEVIAKTMFGMDIKLQDIQETHPFTEHAKKAFKFGLLDPLFLILVLFPSVKCITRYISFSGLLPKASIDFFVNTIEDAIKERKGVEKNYHDFLALMLRTHAAKLDDIKGLDCDDEEEVKGLSHEEILGQALIFMLAGYETTASTLQFCLFFLALNPNIQDKCRAEIDREVGSNELNYDSVNRLEYLEQCIHETLRLCPPVTRIERICTRDTVLERSDGVTIPIKKGESVSAPIYYLQMCEKIWEEPAKFNPDRFNSEERQQRNPYYYMPFGMGPRNCVGMRFAIIELKYALACALKTVRFVPAASTSKMLVLKNSVGLTAPKETIFLKVEKLN